MIRHCQLAEATPPWLVSRRLCLVLAPRVATGESNDQLEEPSTRFGCADSKQTDRQRQQQGLLLLAVRFSRAKVGRKVARASMQMSV